VRFKAGHILAAVFIVLAGACGGGAPVEKTYDLPSADIADTIEVVTDLSVEIIGADIPLEELLVLCSPDCTAKACASPDGCGGFCYNADDCDDGIDCTVDFCVPEGGEGCRNLPLAHLCPDEPPCRSAICDPEEGCLLVDLNGDLCDDDDLCTTSDRCQSGVCAGDELSVAACDDFNPCTADHCDPGEGCLHTAEAGDCNWGTDWLDGHCEDGLCIPDAVLAIPCLEDLDCELFGNDNPCDGEWRCGEGATCIFTVDSVPACDIGADQVCAKNMCDSVTGECQVQPDNEGLPCTDGDACTVQDVCVAGSCVSGVVVLACDDGNPCTKDICDPETGCNHEPQDGPCDDGNACTKEDACTEALCVGTAYLCDDALPCTEDKCDGAGGCSADVITDGWCRLAGECIEEKVLHPTNSCLECLPDIDPLDWSPGEPGSPCLLPHALGGCGGGECLVVECELGYLDCATDDNDGCEVDGDNDPDHCGDCETSCSANLVCSGGKCLTTCPNGVAPCAGSCPDTTSDANNCGECGVVCSAPLPEEVGVCLDGDCGQEPCPQGNRDLDGLPGNGCEYQCESGGEESCDGLDNDCDGIVDEGSCDDGLACTVDVCNPLKGCQNAPADSLCNDGNVCTSEFCDLELGCIVTDLEGSCDDGDACTTGDICQGGQCIGVSIADCCLLDLACDDENPCTEDICNSDSHQCQHLSAPLEGISCNGDDDGCTIETCQNGTCVIAANVECPEAEECQQVACVSSGPLAFTCLVSDLTDGEACDDGLFCTADDSCDESAKCVGGGPIDCSQEAGPCLFGLCDELHDKCVTVALPDELPCNADGDGCTTADSCLEGECIAGPAPDCTSAADECAFGNCLSSGPFEYECVKAPKPADTECDDGLVCTESDGCDGAGSCVGGPPPECPGGDSPCLVVKCDEGSGGCIEEPADDGTVCDDGDDCTLVDLCTNGLCFGSESGCLDRRVNTFTAHDTYHNPMERFDAVALGTERAVALWRAGGQSLRAQLIDDELTKLRPELSLSEEWPPAPGGCSPILGRQALAANSDGDWLVVSSYKWQKFTGYNCKYTNRTCTFEIHYVVSASIWDRDGQVKGEWTDIVPSSNVYQTAPHWDCGSCGCGAVYGSQPDQVAPDVMRAVAFSDGSFGLVHRVSTQSYYYYRLSPTLEPSGPIALDPGTLTGEPAVCSLPGDGVAVIYDDGTGILQVNYLDQDGAYVGGPVALSATHEGQQDRPACARIAGGKLAVAFSSCANGGPCEVHAQVLKSGGAKYGQTVTASSAGDGVQAYDVSVVSTNDGGFALTWHQAIGDADGWSSMLRVYGSDIAPKGSAVRVNVLEVGNQVRPVLAGIEAGILALFEHPTGGVSQNLYLRFFTDDGAPQAGAPEWRVPEVTGDTPRHGDAAGTGEGFAVTWDADGADGDGRGIVLRLFDGTGRPASEEQIVNQTVQESQEEPQIAFASGTDRLLVAWTSLTMADGEDVYARLLTADGQPTTDEIRVNTQIPGDQSQVATAALDGDLFVATWTGYSSEFAGTDVFARLLDSNGDFTGAPFIVHDAFLNDQAAPTVAAVGGDQPGFVVGWTHSAGSPGGVYVRRFDLAGQPVGGAETLIDAFGQPQEATLDVSDSGTIVLCWRVSEKVLCQQLDSELVAVGPQFEVASGTQPAAPTVLFRDNDRIWVLLDETGADADGRGINRLDLDPAGNPVAPYGLMNITEGGDQTEPFIAPLSAGGVVTGWTGSDQPDGDGIYIRVLK
jgi:hypothetical protein